MRRRVRFVTGGEPVDFALHRPRRRGQPGVFPPSQPDRRLAELRRKQQGTAVAGGYRYRLATRQERRDWPVLEEEQSFWLVECDHCDEWAYGRKKRDVAAWGKQHVSRRHAAPDAGGRDRRRI